MKQPGNRPTEKQIIFSIFAIEQKRSIDMSALKYPLNNVQMELMKLFSTDLSEKELEELKTLLSQFYADKAIKTADEFWDQKGLTNEDMDKWLNEKS